MSLKLDGLRHAKLTGQSRLNKLKSLINFDVIESLNDLLEEYKDDHYRDHMFYDLKRMLEMYEESRNKEEIIREIDSLERELQLISNELDNYNVR